MTTTTTDADGNYIFKNIPPATYQVDVLNSTLPTGLSQTTVIGGTADFVGKADPYTPVTVVAGDENLTADFGYNWAPTTNVDNNTGDGAIGDRVWIDANGDGKQQPEELGLQGVTVQLWNDSNGDGVVDLQYGADAITGPTGNYIFTKLPAGIYEVRIPTDLTGYTQTGDPDQPGVTCTACDARTTTPVVLGPGDVYLNADFGYKPNSTAYGASIGNRVWLDANANAIGPADTPGGADATEKGIAGVTVELIRDVDNSGTWNAGDVIIATTITDATGYYLFNGVPVADGTGSDDYLVYVSDTNAVLNWLTPTYDNNGIATPNISRVQDLAPAGDMNQDFGYTPRTQTTTRGMIGDTIFLDRDGGNDYDPGEGIEGVTVRLYDSTGTTILAVTTTDENGNYWFPNLPAGTYVVKVDTTTLPGGLTNSYDPDLAPGVTGDSQSTVTLAAGEINLTRDFGYRGTGTIGDRVWNDLNADGIKDAGESGIDGVTVDLYWDVNANGVLDAADRVVGTTTTTGGGAYSFANLGVNDGDGNINYFVHVTDTANLLDGWWHSTFTPAGTNDRSQVDPYLVTLTTVSTTNYTADFGYYDKPAGLGNYVWEDLNENGIQDDGEPGIAGVQVTLTIGWTGDGTTVVKAVTDALGYYGFGNLLLDEDTRLGGGTGQPSFTLTVAAPPGYVPTLIGAAESTAANDSNNPAGTPAAVVKGATDETYDFGWVVRRGSVGDYVWLDEDGDGDQDAGEPGIANVEVILTGYDTKNNWVSLTTYTDADGKYLFANVPAGSYEVTVNTATMPAGLAANPTYDENGIATPNTSPVTLLPGQEYLTADFGYNWSSPCETNTPGADGCPTPTGAIGDRVWIDDGDGVQEPGEPGLGGVSVQLTNAGGDGIFGTSDDSTTTTTTGADGSYIFDDLLAGLYQVVVTQPANYTQTGDPDQPGALCTTCDNKTTTPIILGPGDVYVNADFGYQPNTNVGANIGDYVWLDTNADGIQNDGATGIANVTVALIKDYNGDGAWDPDGDDDQFGTADDEPIIATTTTNAAGSYLFTGVPVGGNYLVWVNDTNAVLTGLTPTYDNNGIATPNTSAVPSLTTAGNLNQDFGYTPAGQATDRGLIGDTIFLDRGTQNNTADPGEGIEGVTVRLYNSTGNNLLATTITNENGNYWFPNLPAGTYVVKVDTTTLPGGLTNSFDPDGGTANQSSVPLTAGQINLLQDFGYRGTGTIGDLVWNDVNADGIKDAAESGIDGVTVDLYWDVNANGVLDAADKLVGTTKTTGGGAYSFANLGVDDGGGDIKYLVDVTDTANLLNGWWHSIGTPAGTNDRSQVDPYPVTLTTLSQTNNTADFGYYREPAGLGNFVWEDVNGNGIQDAGEPGIPGVVVTLSVTWPSGGGTTLVQMLTDTSGYYGFGNLLLDEDQNGAQPTGEPALSISVATPSGFAPTVADAGGNDALDSDPSGVSATVTEGQTNNTYDFGFIVPAAIGNKVWLDENGDGRQDPGEAGIGNVTVELWNSNHTTLVATTVTDADGNYIFKNLPAGTYQVDVTTGLPAGLVQSTATFTGDFTNKADPYTPVTVVAGTEDLTADFGYNWAPPTDVTGNTGTGAIGDRVWIDDGDGVQEPGEPGLGGVSVQLTNAGGDGIFGTPDDSTTTTTTGADGSYTFDDLLAGLYQVVVNGGNPPTGYAQTGDPDQPGVLCTTCDHKTTTPIVLAPGDVYLNADFGYKPGDGVGAAIGNRIWLDADADGTGPADTPAGTPIDTNEAGIAGVTVALIKDTNNDGVWDRDGVDNILGNPDDEPIIAATTTDAIGYYLFTGVPVADGVGTDDYLVLVNDTNAVLNGLRPTYDNNGTGTPNISRVQDLAPAGNLDQDFGYTPTGQSAARGLIGDTIFLDRDNSGGAPGPGEGIEGVTVRLYDSTGTTLLATTVTDENGNYWFPNLPEGSYTVKVDTTTLPGGGAGLTNSYDPNGGADSQSTVTLTAGQVNLDQDFGYKGTGTIGNLVWNDVNANGIVDGVEAGIDGVTVDLYWDANGNLVLDAADRLMGTETTKNGGAYSFVNLPVDGTTGLGYFVHVSDTANALNGWWHSAAQTAGADNNSQVDPYRVVISSGSPSNPTADFGYYNKPAGLGNLVWWDQNKNGIQDGTEPGIENAVVNLTITWPNGATTFVQTTTGTNGIYNFGNLLLDENMDGAGSGEPTYTISVPNPAGYPQTSPAGIGTDRTVDSGLFSGEVINTTKGTVNVIYDYGFFQTPLAVDLASLNADVREDGVHIAWETVSEANVMGFSVYRGQSLDGKWAKLNPNMIMAITPGAASGNYYEFVDTTYTAGNTYFYVVETVGMDGVVERSDPFELNVPLVGQ